jgi:hypothetical protein
LVRVLELQEKLTKQLDDVLVVEANDANQAKAIADNKVLCDGCGTELMLNGCVVWLEQQEERWMLSLWRQGPSHWWVSTENRANKKQWWLWQLQTIPLEPTLFLRTGWRQM